MTQLLTKAEVADQLHVSISTIDRLRVNGQLRSVRVRGRVRFTREDVQAFLDMGEQLYRTPRPDEVIFRASDLVDGHQVDVDCPMPPPLICSGARWACDNSACCVREITLHGNDFSRLRAAIRCPACGKKLRFLTYLVGKTMLPVRDAS